MKRFLTCPNIKKLFNIKTSKGVVETNNETKVYFRDITLWHILDRSLGSRSQTRERSKGVLERCPKPQKTAMFLLPENVGCCQNLSESVRFWQTLADSGRLWQTLVDSTRLWQILANFGRFWQTLAVSGRTWNEPAEWASFLVMYKRLFLFVFLSI